MTVRATAILLRSIAARSSWRSPVIAVKQASDITSAAVRVNNKGLHQSQQPSLTMLSFQARAFFMFQWIRLSFIHKTHASSSLFSNCLRKNLRAFISHNSVGFRWIFHFLLCKLWQIVNFDGLSFLTALVLFKHQTIWTILTKILISLLWHALWEYRVCWRHCCSLWK